MKITILLNPSAGRGKARRRLRRVLATLRRAGASAEVRESRSPRHLVELARQAGGEKPDLIASAGGDGTHHYVINGLAGADIPLGLLPMGSGNDFAKGLGIPADLEAATLALLNGQARQIDLARAGSPLSEGIAGTGVGSVGTRYVNDPVRWPRGRLA